MSHEEMGDTTGRSASQLAAESVEELVDRRQVAAIWDARDDVRTVLNKGAELQAERPDISDGRILQILTAAVRGYVMELEQLCWLASQDDSIELAEDYWQGADLGELYVPAPVNELESQAKLHYNGDLVEIRNPSNAEDPDDTRGSPVRYGFYGLQSIVEHDPPFRFRWHGVVEARHGGAETVNATREVSFPRHVLLRAYRLGNQFCGDIGLGLRINAEESDYEFEYAELLLDDEPEPPGKEVTNGADGDE